MRIRRRVAVRVGQHESRRRCGTERRPRLEHGVDGRWAVARMCIEIGVLVAPVGARSVLHGDVRVGQPEPALQPLRRGLDARRHSGDLRQILAEARPHPMPRLVGVGVECLVEPDGGAAVERVVDAAARRAQVRVADVARAAAAARVLAGSLALYRGLGALRERRAELERALRPRLEAEERGHGQGPLVLGSSCVQRSRRIADRPQVDRTGARGVGHAQDVVQADELVRHARVVDLQAERACADGRRAHAVWHDKMLGNSVKVQFCILL